MNEIAQAIGRIPMIGALAPLCSIMVAAVVSLMIVAFKKGKALAAEPYIAIAGLLAAISVAWFAWPAASAGGSPALLTDRLALAGIEIICAAAICAVLISRPYLAVHGEGRGGFYGLVLLSVFGMSALAFAGDLIAILIAMEAMSVSLFALTGFMRDRPQSVEGSLKFFMMSAFATAFYCMGLAFIIGSLGSTSLATIAQRFDYVASGEGRSVFLFGIAMVFSGLALKVAAVPFHAWAPDALDGAPTPASLLICTSARAAALIAFLRLASAVAAPGGELWHGMAAAISAATILWGALAAMRQESIKRMLSYLSIAGGGLMLAVLPSLAQAGSMMTRALLFNLIAYSISMAGAFAALVALGLGPGEPLDQRHLCGLSRTRPWSAAALSLFLLSLAGLPPTLGFTGRFYLIMAVAKAGDVALAAVAAAGSAIMLACVLRPVSAMYFREPSQQARPHATTGLAGSSLLIAVMLACALAVIAFGIFPQNLLAFVYASSPL